MADCWKCTHKYRNPGKWCIYHENVPIECYKFEPSPPDKKEPYLMCPNCGHYPLNLIGRGTLALPVDRKAVCPMCMYEEEF